MADSTVNQAAIDAHNVELDFTKYPETGVPTVVEPTPDIGPVASEYQYSNDLGTVQTFDSAGNAEPKNVDTEAAAKNNYENAFPNGDIPQPPRRPAEESNGGSQTVLGPDDIANKQKGYLQEKGFAGDQSLSNEDAAFNKAVDMAAGLTALARNIAAITAKSSRSRSKVNDYFLYDPEKELLQSRARQFASLGIVPYDVLEDFLYILITVDNPLDMNHIACVVGIRELENPNILREPFQILNLKNLYKIGYLANAVASINFQYSTKYYALAAMDHNSSPYSTLQNLAQVSGNYNNIPGGLNRALSTAAAISGAVNLAGAATMVGGNLLNAALGQFPVVNIVTNQIKDIIKDITTTVGLTSLFPALPSLPNTALGKIAYQAAISQLPTIAGNFSNITTNINSTISAMSVSGVASMMPIMGQLSSLTRTIRDIQNITNNISSIANIATTAAKKFDVSNSMIKIATQGASLLSAANGIMSALGALSSPGNIGLAAGMQLAKLGGTAPSGIITELTLGQRIPPSVLYKNPQLNPPSYQGKAFFGEFQGAHGAMDQLFCKRIGAFPSNASGSGTSSFGLQNFASMGGVTSLVNMVSRVLIGANIAPTSGPLADAINQKTANLCNILNVPTNSVLEARRSDHSIPFMIAMASVIVDDTVSPFPTNVHNEGWKLAASVGNEVQRYNPAYLSVCATSL
jgi:hypothetical protein